MPVRPKALERPDRAKGHWRKFLAGNPDMAEVVGDRPFPEGMARVRTGYGHAPNYGVEGAVLMGDAAHPVTPAGGQGANLSVADAAALADAVRASPVGFLADYERRRRPAAERSLRISRGATRAFSLPDGVLGLLLPAALGVVGLRPPMMARFLQGIATAFRDTSTPASGKL
jgi:2-polyprenyl-6-methoxyphenol hydroxylase-like FAD-dependent oxidoreductase